MSDQRQRPVSVAFPFLRDRARAFAIAASRLLQQYNVVPTIVYEQDAWRREGGGAFRRTRRELPNFRIPLDRYKPRLFRLPQFDQFKQALESERPVMQLLGEQGRSPEDVALDLLAALGAAVQPFWEPFLIEWEFNRTYLPIERTLIETDVELEVIAPLIGVHISDDMPLGPSASLSVLSDDEISQGLSLNVIGEITGEFALCDVSSAIRFRYRMPRIRRRAERVDINVELKDVLLALRLLGEGDVAISGWWQQSEDPYRTATQHERWETARTFRPLVVAESDGVRLRELLALVRSRELRRYPSLANALRQFQLAFGGLLAQHQLLDLTSAAESLFADGGSGETRYRLAMHAAYFLSDDHAERRRIFDGVSAAYALRNAITHGRELTEDAHLAEHVLALRRLLRLALTRSLRLAVTRGGAPLVEWDALVMGDPRALDPVSATHDVT